VEVAAALVVQVRQLKQLAHSLAMVVMV